MPSPTTALGGRLVLAACLCGALGIISSPSLGAEGAPVPSARETPAAVINRDVVDMAFGAASCAVRAGAVDNPTTLTVIDYSRPSTEKRLFVYDVRTKALLYAEVVAHGQGSGEKMTTHFSNAPNSHATSLGLFVTAGTYIGKNGYSLRLNGLEQGFNDNALERAIVIHGAPYVNPNTVGPLGRSWGCPALRPAVAREVIDHIKGGNLIFAYGADQQWLKSSKYLGGCAAAAQ